MRITSATFVKGAVAPDGYPPDPIPEVAFVGRSNVGKSTLINGLLNRKGLAKTSGTPGKTREINFFLINEQGGAKTGNGKPFHLVDLPGYGFARVPPAEKAKWKDRLETYLTSRDQLKLVVVLVDVRHKPSELDLRMIDWLAHFERPCLLVATKADKLSRSAISRAVDVITRATGRKPLVVAARKKQGLAELWQGVSAALFDAP